MKDEIHDADSESEPLLPQVSRQLSRAALNRARRSLTGDNPFERKSSTPCLDASLSGVTRPPPAEATANNAGLRNRVRRLAEFARDRQELKAMRGGKGHTYLFSVLSAHSHRREAVMFRTFIFCLILLNILAFILQSDEQINHKYFVYFEMLEGFSSIAFLIEYVARVYITPERKRYASLQPAAARWSWIFSWESFIDLIAMLPWFIEKIADLACVTSAVGCGVELPNLQFLRVLRLFRLLKSAPVIHSFDVVYRVLYFNAEILCVALIICLVLLLLTSTLLYYCQPRGASATKEGMDDFSSIPATMYLSVMMLTGQGQPEGDMPWYTKAIVTITAVFSVAQFAIPASMLTWGFEQEAERRIKKQHENRKKQVERIKRGIPAEVVSSSSSGESYATEWEEYEEVVVGSSDSDAEKAAQKKKRKDKDVQLDDDSAVHLTAQEQARAARIFSNLDRDETGFIKTHELVVITDAKGAATLAEKLDADGDGRTSSEEFFTWLLGVKKGSGDQIFRMLLGDLEAIPAESAEATPSLQPPITKRISPSATSPGLPVTSADVAAGKSVPDAILLFADQFRMLQEENNRLLETLRQRDATIAEMRAGVVKAA